MIKFEDQEENMKQEQIASGPESKIRKSSRRKLQSKPKSHS